MSCELCDDTGIMEIQPLDPQDGEDGDYCICHAGERKRVADLEWEADAALYRRGL